MLTILNSCFLYFISLNRKKYLYKTKNKTESINSINLFIDQFDFFCFFAHPDFQYVNYFEYTVFIFISLNRKKDLYKTENKT